MGKRERERERERERDRERQRDRQRETDRAGCTTLFVFLVSYDCNCSWALPHGAVGCSAVCTCGIS